MTVKAEIITPWVQSTIDGLGLTNRPRLITDHPSISRMTDTTKQLSENLLPKPNMYIVQIECSPETLLEIEDDPLYQVLWSEE